MSAVNPYESPKSESADPVSSVDGPAIWNPNAAANWSLLFSPAFGAYLHARNAERLGRHDEAKSNQRWFYGTLVFLAASILSTFVPVVSDGMFRLVGLVILLTWISLLRRSKQHLSRSHLGRATKNVRCCSRCL